MKKIEYVLTEEQLRGLLASSANLISLEDAGVDNWSGYEYAQDLMEEVGQELIDEGFSAYKVLETTCSE